MIYVIGDVGVEIVRSTPIKPGCIVRNRNSSRVRTFFPILLKETCSIHLLGSFLELLVTDTYFSMDLEVKN